MDKYYEDRLRSMPFCAFMVLGSIIMSLILILIVLALDAHAQLQPAFSEENILRAGIGEASGEGEDGLYAVYCAILNRGTLKGVYGLTAGHIQNEPQWVLNRARKAYLRAKSAYHSGGCQVYGTHWESVRFKEPYWAKSMVKTVKVKNHQFYKERDELF